MEVRSGGKQGEKPRVLKRKLMRDEDLERKREAQLKELYDALKDHVSELQKEKEELHKMLRDTQAELRQIRNDFLEDMEAKDRKIMEMENEVTELKLLLAGKDDKSKSVSERSRDTAADVDLQSPSPISTTRKTRMSREKGEKAVVSCSNSEAEARELDCSGRDTCTSGNGAKQSSIVQMLLLLVGSLVCLKASLNHEAEGVSLSFSHEASGYRFTLTWLEDSDGGEWSYKLSSLGTLEEIAVYWMKEDIRFSMKMCVRFFEMLSYVIKRGSAR
ncbi:hypothetical protein ACP4OV_020584 [Aristida adscensionis]